VRSAVEWAQVRAMAVDGVTQRDIARLPGIDRRTVKRLAGGERAAVLGARAGDHAGWIAAALTSSLDEPVEYVQASDPIGYWKAPFLTSSGATATTLPFLIWTSTGGGTVLSWKWSPRDSNLIGP
jgi:hypothetical protein